MTDRTLYDDDILLWSEQQAAALRELQRTRRIPSDLDFENVAEEIESVGREQRSAVESHIRQIFLHLLKLAAEPGSDAVRHWRSEIVGFASDARGRYAPSMGQRIDLDRIWRSARRQGLLGADDPTRAILDTFPAASPYDFDDLLSDMIEPDALVDRLRPIAGAGDQPRPR
jgi:hypothetical protein